MQELRAMVYFSRQLWRWRQASTLVSLLNLFSYSKYVVDKNSATVITFATVSKVRGSDTSYTRTAPSASL
jgi:hypothetical protein